MQRGRLNIKLAAAQIASNQQRFQQRAIRNLLILDGTAGADQPRGDTRIVQDLPELSAVKHGVVAPLYLRLAVVLKRGAQQHLRSVAGQLRSRQMEGRWRRVKLSLKTVRNGLECP